MLPAHITVVHLAPMHLYSLIAPPALVIIIHMNSSWKQKSTFFYIFYMREYHLFLFFPYATPCWVTTCEQRGEVLHLTTQPSPLHTTLHNNTLNCLCPAMDNLSFLFFSQMSWCATVLPFPPKKPQPLHNVLCAWWLLSTQSDRMGFAEFDWPCLQFDTLLHASLLMTLLLSQEMLWIKLDYLDALHWSTCWLFCEW